MLGKTLHHNSNCNESTGVPLPMLAETAEKELLGMNVYVDTKQDLDRFYSFRGTPRISQISHWLILVAFGYSWTSTITKNGYNPTLPMAKN